MKAARDELLADIATIPRDDPEETTDDRYVYFIQAISGGPIKIGVAGDPPKRLLELQSGNPERLQIIGVIPKGGQSLEARLHAKFRDSRLCGEWFEATDALLFFIANKSHRYDSPDLARQWVLVAPGGNRYTTVHGRYVYTLAEVAESTGWSERSLQRDCAANRYGHARCGERFGMTRQQIDDLIAAHAAPARTPAPTP